MPFVNFANTALLELVYRVNEVVCENTLYFRKSTDYTSGDLDQLIDEVFDWWSNEMPPFLSDQLVVQQVKARDMSTQFGAYREYTPIAGNVGSRSSPVMPNNVSVTVKFSSALIGRRNRGRNYLVGLTEDMIGGNELNSSIGSAIAAAYADLPDYFITPGQSHVIASRATAVGPSWVGVTIPVVSYSVDLGIDTQRRRLQ